jgi:hypothetical protein
VDLHLAGKLAMATRASLGIGLTVTRALTAEGVAVAAGTRDLRAV